MTEPHKNKKIHFNYLRDVVIVPSKEEYIKYDVWWKKQDYIHFKQSALNELILLLCKPKYRTLNLTQALSILYDSNSIYSNF